MMLWVYELKGHRTPGDVPPEDLVGVWPEPPWFYLFYKKEKLGPIRQWLSTNPEWVFTSQYNLPYSTWQDTCLTQTLLERFIISLSPIDSPGSTPPGLIPIRLDPGIVFGTGLHPTTKGCLLALTDLFEHNVIHTVVDLGTGTGILAIACALLGARSVLALDNNPLALSVASRNSICNGVSGIIRCIAADSLEPLSRSPDLLVMNLEWPSMERILHARAWRNARWIVLAGFLPGRLHIVTELLPPGLKVIKIIEEDGWPTVTITAGKCLPVAN